MKQSRYTVVFKEGQSLSILADDPFQAAILASAQKINEGKNFDVIAIHNEETLTDYNRKLALLPV